MRGGAFAPPLISAADTLSLPHMRLLHSNGCKNLNNVLYLLCSMIFIVEVFCFFYPFKGF
jgi:hypothetical protein